MATVPPVEVKAMWDGDDLKSGLAEGETAIKALETQVESSANAVGTALRGMDDTAGTAMTGLGQEVEQGESKLKDMGQTASEEIPGAMTDLSDSTADAVTGLSTAFATLGPGGIALGAALAGIGILLRKSEEAEAQITADAESWADAYLEGLGRITSAGRRAAIETARATEDSPLSQLEELFSGGQSGFGSDDAIAALFGSPEDRARASNQILNALDKAKEKYESMTPSRTEAYRLQGLEVDELEQAADLLDLGAEARKRGRQETEDYIRGLERVGALTKEEIADLERVRERQADTAAAAERQATAWERSAVAAGRLATNLMIAGRNANFNVDVGV